MIGKFTLLNETILDCLNEKSETKIAKAFTDLGVKILEADFGFVWLKQYADQKWVLVYKTPNVPFEPNKPRATGINDSAMKNRKIEYIKEFKSTPYTSNAGKYMKSFVVIPISFKDKAYGTMVLCFKERQSFSKEKKLLSTFLGNGIAQIITIHQSREKTDKLKETAIFLAQEKLRVEFIANATHELRTPVAIIKGNVDLALLARDKNSKAPFKALHAINREVEHLSGILSDLALITSKKTELKHKLLYREIKLTDLIARVVKRFASFPNKKNISIIIEKMPNVVIRGDEMYIERMLLNLIKNSLIYGNDNGHTKIVVKKSKKSVAVSIIDDGIGISKEDLPHIFERFYRADKSHSSSGTSTGLGLAIVKWIVELHGGTVSVKSTKNKGSVFTVTLPR